jgi:carbon starvation protein
MLTEGAVSSLAVLLPAALVFDLGKAASIFGLSSDLLLKAGINVTATPTLLGLDAAPRFYTAWGFTQAIAWSRILGLQAFPSLYKGFYTFAAWALTAFVVTTLDTANTLHCMA